MKGVVLAGGRGTRLHPFTTVINKHLLPVYDRPMIYFPLMTLKQLGVTQVCIVTNKEDISAFKSCVPSCTDMDIMYAVQENPNGVADALRSAKDFCGDDSVAVILGDNIFTQAVTLSSFTYGAMTFVKQVSDPHRFGVIELRDNVVVDIIEKPLKPPTNLAVTGLYVYDATVFDKLSRVKPSARGECEITDLNRQYLAEGTLQVSRVSSPWIDAGTIESLHEATQLVKPTSK